MAGGEEAGRGLGVGVALGRRVLGSLVWDTAPVPAFTEPTAQRGDRPSSQQWSKNRRSGSDCSIRNVNDNNNKAARAASQAKIFFFQHPFFFKIFGRVGSSLLRAGFL